MGKVALNETVPLRGSGNKIFPTDECDTTASLARVVDERNFGFVGGVTNLQKGLNFEEQNSPCSTTVKFHLFAQENSIKGSPSGLEIDNIGLRLP